MNPAICDFRFIKDMSVLKEMALVEDIHKNIVLRPVAYLTFAINYYFHGFNVVGYHLFNVVVHLVNALLFYLLTSLTLDSKAAPYDDSGHSPVNASRLIALFAALVFVAHPLQTQSVTYITQRFTSLAALFFLLSLVLYIKSGRGAHPAQRAIYYAGSLLAACVAMKTKEIAFTLPIMLLTYDCLFIRNSLKIRLLKLAPFMLTMAIIPLTVIKLAKQFPHADAPSVGHSMNLVNYAGVSQWDYLFTQFRIIVTYLRLLLIPVEQRLDYDYPLYKSLFQPPVALSLSLIVFLLGCAVYLVYLTKSAAEPRRTSVRLIAFGIIWFFVTLSVESSLIPLDEYLVEQRVYLPSVGFVMACVASLAVVLEIRLRAGVTTFTAIIAVWVAVLSATAYARNNLWLDPIVLWRDTAHKSPMKARPHLNMGAHYFEKGRLADALQAFTTAQRLEPEKVDTSFNIANANLALNRVSEAEAEYLRAIAAHPADERLYNNLSRIYIMHNKHDKALPLLLQVVRMQRGSAGAHIALAELYEAMGRRDNAATEYVFALQLTPGDAVITNRLIELNKK
jgi:Tfp pilus assembly protein PilF